MAYIVKREIADNGPAGSTYGYVKVDKPHIGETIYRGKFAKDTDYGDQKFDSPRTVYVPVDPSQIREEKYTGEVGKDVEEF